jgi:sterol desaturase/sphingolipid hydroxylase (fatty acid hydroxylase superfamily)
MRSYWLEVPLQTVCLSYPTVALVGIDTPALLMLPFAMTGWLYLAHANLRLHLGPLGPILCGPQVHRIHHSDQSRHKDKNFAQFFPIYDVLFGTYYAPARNEYPTTGTPGLASDASFGTVLLRPFRVWFGRPDN